MTYRYTNRPAVDSYGVSAYVKDADRATRGTNAVAAVDRFKTPQRRALEAAALARGMRRDESRLGMLGRFREPGVSDAEIRVGGGGGGGPSSRHPLRRPPLVGQILPTSTKYPGVRKPPRVLIGQRPPILVAPPIRVIGPGTPPTIKTFPAIPAGGGSAGGGGGWSPPVDQIPDDLMPPDDDELAELDVPADEIAAGAEAGAQTAQTALAAVPKKWLWVAGAAAVFLLFRK